MTLKELLETIKEIDAGTLIGVCNVEDTRKCIKTIKKLTKEDEIKSMGEIQEVYITKSGIPLEEIETSKRIICVYCIHGNKHITIEKYKDFIRDLYRYKKLNNKIVFIATNNLDIECDSDIVINIQNDNSLYLKKSRISQSNIKLE